MNQLAQTLLSVSFIALTFSTQAQAGNAQLKKSDVSKPVPIAYQIEVKGATAERLMGLLDKLGIASSDYNSFDVRHMRVQGRVIYSDDGSPSKTKFSQISLVNTSAQPESKQTIELDMAKVEAQQLGRLLKEIGGEKVQDAAMAGRFGFNAPWITCYGETSYAKANCSVQVAGGLDLDDGIQ